METKNKKKKITSKSLRVYAIIFLVVGAVYILSGIYSFFTTVSGYISQGYATSEVLAYLLPSQFLPTVIEPLAIFGGFALLLFGISEVLSRLGSEDNETANEIEITEEVVETEVIDDVQEEVKGEEVDVIEGANVAEDSEDVIEADIAEENTDKTAEETEDNVIDTDYAEDNDEEKDSDNNEDDSVSSSDEEKKDEE